MEGQSLEIAVGLGLFLSDKLAVAAVRFLGIYDSKVLLWRLKASLYLPLSLSIYYLLDFLQ